MSTPSDHHDPTHHDSVLAFARGDRAEAEQLRRALEAIRAHVTDARLAGRIQVVLEGRAPVRELTRDPAFVAELDRGMTQFAAHLATMTPEERVELARRGKQETAALRQDLGMPPEADPAPIGQFGPALLDLGADAPS